MPSLRNMVGGIGVIEIPVSNDEPLIVYYHRGKKSPRKQIKILTAQQKMAELQKDGIPHPDMLVFMVDLLAGMIHKWNLTDDDGTPIGTDAESLQDVDLDILTGVLQEIGRQTSADPLSNSGSNNGLLPTASLEPRQIGIPSS